MNATPSESDEIQTLKQRADTFEDRLEATRQIVEANSLGIAELRANQAEMHQTQSQLQIAQAQLVQMFSQQQDSLQEFKRTTNAALDRMERNQAETNRELEALRQEQMALRQEQMALRQEQLGMQTEIRRILDYLLRRDSE